MRHGSLFSGVGGFDLAAEWMGWENVFHCEWNEFGRKVLSYYWPNSISYGDIKETDFGTHRGSVDIISGGFPCQPFSAAGKRKGTEDDRHLWPEMLRAIREIRPRYVVGENVFGLVNWSGGLVFEMVQADLEAEGYEVWPIMVPACGVDAPHRRDRIWFIAYGKSARNRRGLSGLEKANDRKRKSEKHGEENTKLSNNGYRRPPANADGEGLQVAIRGKQRCFSPKEGASQGRKFGGACTAGEQWQNFPTVSPLHSRNDGLSDRLDGITFSKLRNESIKAYGNAVVPQVVYRIFKAIEETDETLRRSDPDSDG